MQILCPLDGFFQWLQSCKADPQPMAMAESANGTNIEQEEKMKKKKNDRTYKVKRNLPF